MQGWLKSTRNSYLNTGSFPRNHIWMYGVLKKSIFAYLKFHICIPKILYLHTMHTITVKVNISCYHRPFRPCQNFSVPASVKARSSLVYNVFHQIGKIRTSGILGKGYEFWQELWAKLILESISEYYRKYFIKTFVWLFPVATHVKTQMDCSIQNDQKSHIWIPALLESHKCIPGAQFFHIWMSGFRHSNVLLVTPVSTKFFSLLSKFSKLKKLQFWV